MFLKNIEADSYFSLRNIWFLKYELAAGYLNTSVKMYHLYLLNKWNNWLPGPRVQCSLINDKFSEFSSQTVPCVRVSCSKSCHLRGSYNGLISLSMSKFDSLISKRFLYSHLQKFLSVALDDHDWRWIVFQSQKHPIAKTAKTLCLLSSKSNWHIIFLLNLL